MDRLTELMLKMSKLSDDELDLCEITMQILESKDKTARAKLEKMMKDQTGRINKPILQQILRDAQK